MAPNIYIYNLFIYLLRQALRLPTVYLSVPKVGPELSILSHLPHKG